MSLDGCSTGFLVTISMIHAIASQGALAPVTPATVVTVVETDVVTYVTDVTELPVTETAVEEERTSTGWDNRTDIEFETQTVLEDIATAETQSTDADVDSASKVKWTWLPIRFTIMLSMQMVSAVIGIVGNLLVIIVLFKRRALNRSTDTLINALAVADFMTSVFLLPVPTANTMPSNFLGWFYCLFIFNRMYLWICVSSSIYILVAISVERYIAVKYPIYFNRKVTKRRVKIVIGCMWLIGFVIPCPARAVFKIDHTTHVCIIVYDPHYVNLFVTMFLVSMRLILPIATMIFTQTAIIIELYRQSKKFRSINSKAGNTTPSFHIVARTRVIKMMMVVISFFIVFWTPVNVFFSLIGFKVISTSHFQIIDTTIYDTFIVMGCYNSCVNPIIYTLRGANFRSAVKDLFRSSTDTSTFSDRGGLF